MKDYEKNIESSYFKYWDLYSLYGQVMPLKLPVNKFEWIEDIAQFTEDFIKNIMKKVIKDISSKLMFNIQKKYMNFIMICHFYQKE